MQVNRLSYCYFLDAEAFFAHPYQPWEHGLNENTNIEAFVGEYDCYGGFARLTK